MSRVQEALDAWRRAARRLEATDDPQEQVTLEREVEALRHAYLAAVREAVDEDGEDTQAASAYPDEPQ